MNRKSVGWLHVNLIAPLAFGRRVVYDPDSVAEGWRLCTLYFVNTYFELQFLRRGFNGYSLYLYLSILYLVYLFIFESCKYDM